MKLFSCMLVLFMVMMVGNNSYACEWVRARPIQTVVVYAYPPSVYNVYPVYIAPQPQPVVTYETVLVPVVQQGVQWVWPNYYQVQPVYIRPTLIRY